MSRNDKTVQELVVTEYMQKVYNYNPNFLNTGIDIPDCYFEFNKEFYAIEVTRYFQQNSEKKHSIYVNDIEKCLKCDNFIEEVSKRLGKVKQEEELIITFCDLEELKQLIINNIKLIEQVNIGNNYFFNKERLERNNALCCGIPKENIPINDFINYSMPYIMKEEHINIDIFTKNKYSISINLKFCNKPYWGKNTHKKVVPLFLWTEKENELYDNIINAIEIKNQKLCNEYRTKLKNNNIEYDYYNLVVYAEGIGAKLNVEELYNRIMLIKDLSYDEIAIFLWKKLLIINKNGYKVIDKN